MLERIHCRNYRGFRLFDTELSAVTALLGPNSSGKTTVLQAIRFACDALRLGIAAGTAKLDPKRPDWLFVTQGLLFDHTQLCSLVDWQALFVDQLVGANKQLEIGLEFDDDDPVQAIEVVLVCTRTEQLKLTVAVRASQAVARSSPSPRRGNRDLIDYLEEHAPVAVFVPPFYGTVPTEEYRSRAVVDRLLGAGDQSHVVRNLVVALSTEQLRRLNAFLQDTVGARITQRTSEDEVQRVPHLSVRFRDNNGDIELSAAGAGLINLIALYTALSRWRTETTRRRVLFLLDEPEAHLHPRLQADMTARLARLVTDEFDAQLILATHSVDILNRLSTRGASLIRCDRRASPAAVTLDSDSALFDDLCTWVDMTPFTAINFLASRRVLFCEGEDELALLPRLAQVAFRNTPARLDAFRRWSLVRLLGGSNRPIADLLARLVRNDVVRARAQQSTFFIEVVLDRDYEREPGTTSVERDGVHETTTVWPVHSLESMMLERGVLLCWIRALLGEAVPVDLEERVERALSSADEDEELNRSARHRLAAKLAMATEHRGERELVHAQRAADAQVAAHPAVWQRGKDRARFVLGHIRPHIALPARNQFPTDIIRLVDRANADAIGDPSSAIPGPARTLLNRLVDFA